MSSGIASKPGLRAPRGVALGLSAMLLASAGPVTADEPATAVDRYRALALAYREGDHSGSRSALWAWSQEQVMEALAPALTPRVAGDVEGGFDDPTVLAAALLHTEVALSALRRLMPIRARFHVETARDLIGRLVEAPFPGFQNRWRVAVVCDLRVNFYLSEAQQLLEESSPPGAPDPRSLVLLGSVHELRSTYRNPICSSRDECPNRGARTSYDAVERERKGEMDRAATCYRQALEKDPEVREARLRLGRTLARSGRVEAARAHLRRVLRGPAPARTAYMTHLFLGQSFEQDGELEASVAEYREAVAALPRGQAGRLALAHALRRLGDRAGEREALAGLIGEEGRPLDPFDPWWVYAARPAVCSDELWEALREEALS